ncbi:MAG: macro domain-containing protein [Desulfovibrio sp.]|nr:macro domain-containing protein [Desulfovibrio sp.]
MAACWNFPGPTRLCLRQGDITTAPVDAIVNAANAGLAGGGGVDGAIHDAAGWRPLQQACQDIIHQRGPLHAGEAVITPGFALPAAWIIHTVGPIWRGGEHGEAAALRSCYLESLRLARERGARTVAFPAVSCGVYGYPVDQAAAVALAALAEGLQQAPGVDEAAMWLYADSALQTWTRAAVRLFGAPSP